MVRKHFAAAFLASVSWVAMGCLAHAQDVGSGTSRVVSFGDSLTDNGNLFIATGGVNPPSPPYNKRFTNGLTFAEYLNGPMAGFFPVGLVGPGNVNFAFGGARTDSIAVTPNQGIPGTADQINAYAFRQGTYGPSTLVTYFAGANNLFQGLAAAAADPLNAPAFITNVAQLAANDAGNQLNQLAASGAQKILVYNIPDLGAAPAYKPFGAGAVQLASFAASTFNAKLDAATAAAAAAHPSTNFVQIDTNALIAAIIANPAAFGFDNVTGKCVTTAACVTGTFAQQNRYLFWDDVHPTDAGHRLLAKVTQQYLFTSSLAAGAAVLGESSFWLRHGRMLDTLDRLRRADARIGITDFDIGVFGEANRHSSTVNIAAGIGQPFGGFSQKSASTTGGLRIGAVRGIDANWAVSFNLSAQAGRAKSGMVSADVTSFGGDVAARWRQGPLFVTASLGTNVDVFNNYRRSTLVAGLEEKAQSIGGWSASAALEGGYDLAYGALTVTPVARLALLSATTDKFSESGIAAVDFGKRTLNGVAAAGELRLRYAIGDHAAITALLGYEGFASRSAANLKGKLANNTALPFATPVAALASPGVQFGFGIESKMGSWTAGLNYRGAAGSHQVSHSASLQIATHW